MISGRLVELVRCPDCRGRLTRSLERLICSGCDRKYPVVDGRFVDLRPAVAFEEQTKYLDESLHADGRHEHVSPPLLSAGVRYRMLQSLFPITAVDRVVDLGGGSGRVLYWNRNVGATLTGIDVSPYFAVEASKEIDLLVGDLRRLPVADGAFNKAVSFDVLEHLSRDGIRAVLAEAHRVLDVGGQLFVYSHVRKNAWIALGLRAINGVARALETVGLVDLSQGHLQKSDHLNPLIDHADLRRVVAECGFHIARIRYYTPLIGGVVENILVRMVERWMVRRRASSSEGGTPTATAGEEALRAARRDAKASINQGGVVYRGLTFLTWVMMLDILLFGRVQSGPFFAVLMKQPDVEGNVRDEMA